MYCLKCGKQIDEQSDFCRYCGASQASNISNAHEYTDSKMQYVGKVYKCPNCGENVDSINVKCPMCGIELHREVSTKSIQSFIEELQKINDQLVSPSLFNTGNKEVITRKKIDLIRNYPIPNSAEDILEFMFLAVSNIESEEIDKDEELCKAWRGKLEQSYQKAKFTLHDSPYFPKIQALYEPVMKQFEKDKR